MLIENVDPVTDPYTEPIKDMIIDDFEAIEDGLGLTHYADDKEAAVKRMEEA